MQDENNDNRQMIKSIHFHIFHACNLNKTDKLGFSAMMCFWTF